LFSNKLFLNKGLEKYIKNKLKTDYQLGNINYPPLILQNITVEHIGQYISWYNHTKDKKLSKESVRLYLASVKDLFRTYMMALPDDYQRNVDLYDTGYAKDTAEERNFNGLGKEAMPFKLFASLSREVLKKSKNYLFLRTSMILQWNLMCRADNLKSLKWNHIDRKGDALQVYFKEMKNDQTGDRSKNDQMG
jgi:integrase